MARTREFNTEKVLKKAISLFWHKGYNGISTQHLSSEFEISKSSMYGAFGDKMELFTAALQKYSSEISENTIKRLANCKSVKTEIRDILADIVKKALTDKEHKGCFIVNSCVELAPHNKRISEICTDHRKLLERAFADAIRKGIENGEMSNRLNPEHLSIVICNAINGLQVDSKYLKDKEHFDNVIHAIMSLLA